jgi:hypothetical protein
LGIKKKEEMKGNYRMTICSEVRSHTIELGRRHLVEVNEQAAVFVSGPKGTDFTRRLHPCNLFFRTFIHKSLVIYCSTFGKRFVYIPPICYPFQVPSIRVREYWKFLWERRKFRQLFILTRDLENLYYCIIT